MRQHFKEILFEKETLLARVQSLAQEINHYYQKEKLEDVLVIPILDGSLVFAGQILPYLDFDLSVRGTKISSYYNTKASNRQPKIELAIDFALVKDRHILIFEDLIDQGYTLKLLKKYLYERGAKDVKICVFFNKLIKDHQQRSLNLDWTGFEIADQWVAGFGVDSQSKFRNAPFFGVVK